MKLFKYHCKINLESGETADSWGLMPVEGPTPILDALYDPENDVLRIYMDSTREGYFPYYKKSNSGKFTVEERKMEQYYQSMIKGEDIPTFLNLYATNNFEYTKPVKIITGEE